MSDLTNILVPIVTEIEECEAKRTKMADRIKATYEKAIGLGLDPSVIRELIRERQTPGEQRPASTLDRYRAAMEG